MRFPTLPPVTKNLLIVNVLIWAAATLIPSLDHALTRYAALHYFSSPIFNVAQLFTYMFVHAGFTHLFFNMFGLWMFGTVIERAMGSQRFLFYYISCGLLAGLCQMGVYAIMINRYAGMFSPADYSEIVNQGWRLLQDGYNYTGGAGALNALVNGPMVGASGAIYGIILAFGMLFPNQPIYLFFIPVPIKAKWVVIGYGVIELTQGLTGAANDVAHFAHLGGMIAGVALILYWKKKGIFNNHWFF